MIGPCSPNHSPMHRHLVSPNGSGVDKFADGESKAILTEVLFASTPDVFGTSPGIAPKRSG